MKKGLTYGEFSNISKGHIAFLENTRKLCDSLIVAIKEDNGIKTTTERTEDLFKTNLVDDVVPVVSASDCVNMIDEYGINIYFYGNKANILDLNCETVFVDSGNMLIPNLVVVTGHACTLRCKNCANFSPMAPRYAAMHVPRLAGDYCYVNDEADFRERLINYVANPHHMEACRYCNGTWNTPLIEPAVQLS